MTVASYDAGDPLTAHVEPLAVGDALPEAPLFLQPRFCVGVPLETTYQRSWAVFPQVLQQLVESGEEEDE